MTSDDQDQQQTRSAREQSQEQQEALYGPAGKADHRSGETISFASADTKGKELTGEILYVRAPAPAIKGGRIHPTVYIVHVPGESFPRAVYPGDVLQRHKPEQEQ